MNSKIPIPSMVPGVGWLRFWPPLLALLLWGNAYGAYQDIDITCPLPHVVRTYAAKLNTSITPPEQIVVIGASGNVFWDLAPAAGCSGAAPNFTCAGMTIAVPNGAVPQTEKVNISSGTLTTLASSSFALTVTADDPAGTPTCTEQYLVRVTSEGGGWGDPHITTVDGVHYDFQSAGEFVALRGKGLEIQTRQTAVPSASVPQANPYTGLRSCVSIYTAVAARVGKHRVSYQPSAPREREPGMMELRVDGLLKELGPEGIDLESGRDTEGYPVGGRIVKSPAGSGIEIYYADGTKVVVTPAWWEAQQTWYLNVNVYETTATEGIFGRIARDGWLPALPDGSSLGPRPNDMHERYVALYEKFANAWRVNDDTSLFDYAPGTSTKTFTLLEWPRDNPTSCTIEGKRPAASISMAAAKKLCGAIADKNMREDCVFDVAVTGNPGFAETYQLTEQLRPGPTVTTVKDDRDPTIVGEEVTFTATVAPKLCRSGQGAPVGAVQFIVDGREAGASVPLDSNGRATWSTSKLKVGKHEVVAKYLPSGWGDLFESSSSPVESHTVGWRGK
jgi:hypothetical protein